MIYHPHPKPPKPAPHPHQVAHAVQVCVATLKALPTNYDREVALGEIISTLKHVEMIKSLAAIYTQTLLLIDHYSNGTIEPRAY